MSGTSTWSRVRGWFSTASADDGMALATVAAMSAILFLLATTLVMLASQEQVSAGDQVARSKALQAADSGINYGLYYVSRYSLQSNLTTTGVTADGAWTMTMTNRPPSNIETLTVTGSVPAQGGMPAVSRTVVSTARPASFSDYMFLFNNYLNLGSGGKVQGNVRSNSYVINNGEITGYTYAAGTITGGGLFDKSPLYPNYPTQSFAVVNFGNLKTVAQGDNTYYPDSGTFGTGANTRHYLGYNVVFSGSGGSIQKVESISTTTGVMITDPSPSASTSFTIPPNGVMYFDDPIWLGGTYSGAVTIVVGKDAEDPGTDPTYGREAPGMGSSASQPGTNTASSTGPWSNNANSSVFLWKNFQSSNNANPTYVAGIVTPGDISIISEYPDTVTPTSLTIQAAMLTTMGSIHADWTTNRVKSYLKILGAEAMWDQGFVQSTSGGTVTMGFTTRDYFYDPNLDITTPPNFPPLGDGELHVTSWVEH